MANTANEDVQEYTFDDEDAELAFDISGEETEAIGTTRRILRVTGDWDTKRNAYVPQPVSFTALIDDEEFEATYAIGGKQLPRLGGISRRIADYADGSGRYDVGTTQVNAIVPDMQVMVEELEKWVDQYQFVHWYMQRQQNAEWPFARTMARLRKLRVDPDNGNTMFTQQRGMNKEQWQRAKEHFIALGGRPGNKSGRIVEAYTIDRRKRPYVLGFDLGQDDLTRSNPPGRGFHDPLSAFVKHVVWSSKTDRQMQKLQKVVENQQGDEAAKTQQEIDRLAEMLRYFNLAGIDRVHVRKMKPAKEGEEPEPERDEEGRVIMVPTNRYRSAEAPVGSVDTMDSRNEPEKTFEYTLWGRRGAASTTESPSTEEAEEENYDDEEPF